LIFANHLLPSRGSSCAMLLLLLLLLLCSA